METIEFDPDIGADLGKGGRYWHWGCSSPQSPQLETQNVIVRPILLEPYAAGMSVPAARGPLQLPQSTTPFHTAWPPPQAVSG